MATSHPVEEEEELGHQFDQIMIAPHKIKYINTKHKKVNAKMYDYRCDIKLRVCNSNFKAHKEVLSEASDYFSAMFSHDMLERGRDVIELLDISPEGFSLLLDYFYHGHVTVEPHTIEDIIEAARFFQVEWVVAVACDFLIHQLSTDNYQTVLHLADKYLLGDLGHDIFRFLGSNLVRLAREEKDFFSTFDLDLLTKFLKEDFYIEADEEFVLDLVLKWVSARAEERQDLLVPLLRLVRFPLLEPDTLDGLSKRLNLDSLPEIADAVEEAKHYNNMVASQSLHTGLRFSARGSRPTVVMFSFGPDCNSVTYQDAAEPRRQCREELRGSDPRLSTELETSSVARLGNFLYRTGGYDPTVCSSRETSRYDPRFRTWTELAPMNYARVSHAMCASHDALFVLGGIDHTVDEMGDQDTILSTAEVYDVQENTWRELGSRLPGEGSYNQAVVFQSGSLYLCGGISADPFDSVPMQSLWRYDFELGQRGAGRHEGAWQPCQDMLYTRQGHAMEALGSKLYVFGGYTALDNNNGPFRDCFQTEVYDTETNQWTELRPVPDTFGHVMRSVGLWGRKIFMYGGGCLHTYHVDEDRMEYGDYYGHGMQKIAVLDVAYPV